MLLVCAHPGAPGVQPMLLDILIKHSKMLIIVLHHNSSLIGAQTDHMPWLLIIDRLGGGA